MKNVMKEAHKLAKEIKAEFPEVDYKAQLGICISYLSMNKGEVKMVELQGTEKQIKWAEDIRSNIEKKFNEKIALMEGEEKTPAIKNELIRNRQYFRNKVKTTEEARVEYVSILKEIKVAILSIENASWFIAYRNIEVENSILNYFNVTNTSSAFPKAK